LASVLALLISSLNDKVHAFPSLLPSRLGEWKRGSNDGPKRKNDITVRCRGFGFINLVFWNVGR